MIPLHEGFRKTLSPHPPAAPSSLGTPFPGVSYGACETELFRICLVLPGDQILLRSQKPVRKTIASWQNLPTCALARDGRLGWGVCVISWS